MGRFWGQAAMVHDWWWGVELQIPLLKHTKYYHFCVKSVSTDANMGEVCRQH